MSVQGVKIYSIGNKQLRLKMLESINKLDLKEGVKKVQNMVDCLKRYRMNQLIFGSFDIKSVY